MKQAKNIIQRNLPINQQYTLLETFYSSIEDSGTCCENCGRPISNIAKVIGNDDKLIRLIGMDCAETLTSIKDSLAFEKYAFKAGKTARAAIMKMLKKQEQDSLEKSDKKQKTEDNDKTQQAAKKLLASNGNENLLTAEEREALGTYLS